MHGTATDVEDVALGQGAALVGGVPKQQRSHSGGEIDDDVDSGLTDAIDHLAEQRRIPAELALPMEKTGVSRLFNIGIIINILNTRRKRDHQSTDEESCRACWLRKLSPASGIAIRSASARPDHG
jgi:hypothetical protein